MNKCYQIIQERIDAVKKLMNYVDCKGNPKDEKSIEYYLWDWYLGNTRYRKLTNRLISSYRSSSLL